MKVLHPPHPPALSRPQQWLSEWPDWEDAAVIVPSSGLLNTRWTHSLHKMQPKSDKHRLDSPAGPSSQDKGAEEDPGLRPPGGGTLLINTKDFLSLRHFAFHPCSPPLPPLPPLRPPKACSSSQAPRLFFYSPKFGLR